MIQNDINNDETKKTYYELNKDKIKIKNKLYYEKNKDKLIKKNAEYVKLRNTYDEKFIKHKNLLSYKNYYLYLKE